jgi:hypothetical protein
VAKIYSLKATSNIRYARLLWIQCYRQNEEFNYNKFNDGAYNKRKVNGRNLKKPIKRTSRDVYLNPFEQMAKEGNASLFTEILEIF